VNASHGLLLQQSEFTAKHNGPSRCSAFATAVMFQFERNDRTRLGQAVFGVNSGLPRDALMEQRVLFSYPCRNWQNAGA
jgi:hypothetical protein